MENKKELLEKAARIPGTMSDTLNAMDDLYEAMLKLIDAVEKYVRQECSRSTLLAMKDKLKAVLNQNTVKHE